MFLEWTYAEPKIVAATLRLPDQEVASPRWLRRDAVWLGDMPRPEHFPTFSTGERGLALRSFRPLRK